MTYRTRRQLPLDVMVLLPLLVLIVFSYVPMAGIVIAFQKFIPAKGLFGDQKWIGLDNFIYIANLPHAARAFRNSLIIASLKIVFGLIVPIVVALLLNEIRIKGLRRTIQTVIYLPHFLSWVILAGVLIDILSPSRGFVNRTLTAVSFEPIFFLADPAWFRVMIVVSHVWKEFGFGTIIYLAAITTIDPGFYEAAVMDGARRLRQMWHITIPGMAMVIILIAALSLGSVLERRVRADPQPLQPARVRDRRHHRHPGLSHRHHRGAVRPGDRGRPLSVRRGADSHLHLLLSGVPVRELPDLLTGP